MNSVYLQLYGLESSPFNITADPNFFFESISHKEALAALFYGIQEKKGIMLITGEVGTGKTTLCKTLLNRLSAKVRTSLILSHPSFSEVQLLNAIIDDFGLKVTKRNRFDIIKELNVFLVDIARKGGNAILIIDEAQNLNTRQLEQIRLLSNLETSQEKLLQIVLFGQPELTEKLNRHNLRQIKQRIFVKQQLTPLREEEVQKYVEFRLSKAGINDICIMQGAYELIWEFSQGIPRLVNMLCDRVLLLGFVNENKTFDSNMVRMCKKELDS